MADNPVFPVFVGTDFLTSGGVPVTNASSSTVGETYTLQGGATPGTLVVNDEDGDLFFEDSFSGGADTPNNETGGLQTLAAGSDPQFGDVGDILELESALTFSGDDGSTVTLLIVNNQSIGGALFSGEFFIPLSPLQPGVTYTLDVAEQDPDPFPYASLPCFVSGTMIRMEDGSEKPVEDIKVGDRVATLDHGAQTVRWVGAKALTPVDLYAQSHLRPIRVRAGRLGASKDILVSPQHRFLIRDWRAELMFGNSEVLVRAQDLIDGETVEVETRTETVSYHHILFDAHEIIFAEGAMTESFHPGSVTLNGLDAAVQEEIFELFPELETDQANGYGRTARPVTKAFENRAFLRLAS
ncbi:MAG: Hint domain-containing protein [Pseudomonadota bacterium]